MLRHEGWLCLVKLVTAPFKLLEKKQKVGKATTLR